MNKNERTIDDLTLTPITYTAEELAESARQAELLAAEERASEIMIEACEYCEKFLLDLATDTPFPVGWDKI